MSPSRSSPQRTRTRGRPVTIDAKRVLVTLDAATIERARVLGQGNVSAGIRLALARVKLRVT